MKFLLWFQLKIFKLLYIQLYYFIIQILLNFIKKNVSGKEISQILISGISNIFESLLKFFKWQLYSRV